jgi:hypothetical protein
MNELLEKLSNLEHEQWVKWSKTIAKTETISDERVLRWADCWVPYSDLSEEMKDHDRKWAHKSLDVIKPHIEHLEENKQFLLEKNKRLEAHNKELEEVVKKHIVLDATRENILTQIRNERMGNSKSKTANYKRRAENLEKRIKALEEISKLNLEAYSKLEAENKILEQQANHDAQSYAASSLENKELKARIKELEETHRMQLAGISVISNCNTADSLKKQSMSEGNPYWSVAFGDVVIMMKREIKAIETITKLKEVLEYVVTESGTSTNYNLKARTTLQEVFGDEE